MQLSKMGRPVVAGLVLCTGVAFASIAQAADLGGGPRRGSLKDDYVAPPPAYKFYIGIRGGATFADDTDFGALGLTIDNEYESGYFVGGTVGVVNLLGIKGLRGDIEAGFISSDIESHTLSTGAKFSGGNAFGTTDITYGIASLYYDFDIGSTIKPFIGAGGGIADVSFDSHGITGVNPALDDSDTAYAYHLTGGVQVELAKGLNLEVAYRYFGTTGAELTAVDGTSTEVDTGDHQILVGLTQKF